MSIFFRTLLWVLVYILLLGAADINVRYVDGLHISMWGWVGYIKRKWTGNENS